MTTSAKTNELLGKIISQTVPTQLLEIMKKNRPYNNEVDATMSNPHFRTATLNIIARGVQVTHFTDGQNELYFFGEGANTQIWNGCSVMSR